MGCTLKDTIFLRPLGPAHTFVFLGIGHPLAARTEKNLTGAYERKKKKQMISYQTDRTCTGPVRSTTRTASSDCCITIQLQRKTETHARACDRITDHTLEANWPCVVNVTTYTYTYVHTYTLS